MQPAESNSSSNFPCPPPIHQDLESDLMCTEPFNQIMENQGQEVVSSTNSTRNERKRLSSTDEGEEKERNATGADSNVTKVRRVNSSSDEVKGEVVQYMQRDKQEGKEQGHNERGEDYGNQDSEQRESGEKGDQESEKVDGNQEHNSEEEEGDGNQENNNEEGEKEESQPVVEGKKEGERDDEKERGTRKRTLSELYEWKSRTDQEEEEEKMAEDTEGEKQDDDQQEHTENAEREDHDNNQNSENENQESEQNEGEEDDGEHDENRDNEDEEEEQEVEDEEEKRKAIAKGKRPMSEICKLEFIVPKFSTNLQSGETSRAEDDAEDNPPEEELNQDNHDDVQDLAILKSISHFFYSNGYVPYPSSDVLHNHIMDSVPKLRILGEDLVNRIVTLEDNFRTVWALDVDNPDILRPIDREIFDLSTSIWVDFEDDAEKNQGSYDVNIQYKDHDVELPDDPFSDIY